jgi:methyl-accepting chemotaxis protein
MEPSSIFQSNPIWKKLEELEIETHHSVLNASDLAISRVTYWIDPIDEIVTRIHRIGGLSQEVSAASLEQSKSVVQNCGAMGQATQQCASAHQKFVTTSEELSRQVGQLKASVSFSQMAGARQIC